ncbi:hypothetical protein [Taibaiella koreensis]|uniref:hypothetical protein n=1 Tax=Taibaiella koreensis TaxID=1268548 RepID=UPI000E5A00B4|nr:hypothetical protein [Taibaiella koreensis]
MRKTTLLALLGCILFTAARAQSVFDYDDAAANGIKAGILTSLSLNSSAPMVKKGDGYSHTAKGAISMNPSFGGFIQMGLGQRFSVRGSVVFGYSSYAYKYGKTFDSLTDNFTPVLSSKYSKYTTVKHGSAYVMPQLDLGYLFGPFKKVYLVELRGGVGLHAYLGQSNDSIAKGEGKVTDPKNRYTYQYYNTESATYGQPNTWGSLTGNVYVGLRWYKTTSDFLNHFAIGIQAVFPIYTQQAGYATLEYKNYAYEVITREKVEMSLFSFGIRASYSFL